MRNWLVGMSFVSSELFCLAVPGGLWKFWKSEQRVPAEVTGLLDGYEN